MVVEVISQLQFSQIREITDTILFCITVAVTKDNCYSIVLLWPSLKITATISYCITVDVIKLVNKSWFINCDVVKCVY